MVNNISLKTIKRESSFFLISALLFLFGMMLAQIADARIAQLLQLVAIGSFVAYGIKISTFSFKNNYFRVVFILLVVWNLFTIFRGLNLSYEQIKLYLFSDFIFWPYVIPFVAFLPKNRMLFHKLFDWLTYSGIFFLLVAAIAAKVFSGRTDLMELVIVVFSSGCGFILLTWKYHSATRRIFAAVVIIIALVISALLARRNVMLTNINFFLASFLLYFFHYAKGDPLKKIGAIIMFVAVAITAFIVFQERKDTDFKLIVNRASEDTREYVFDYFFSDIDDTKWIGKGMNGTYFCPLFIPDSEPIEDRDLIECGYLQMILKGGYISLILFLMITLPAVYLGLFKSNNGIAKACGTAILLWLIDMVPFGIPSFSIKYILVWFSIGVCYSRSFRMLNDRYFMPGVNKYRKIKNTNL